MDNEDFHILVTCMCVWFDAYVMYKMKHVKENESLPFKEFEKAIADEFRSLSIKTKNY